MTSFSILGKNNKHPQKQSRFFNQQISLQYYPNAIMVTLVLCVLLMAVFTLSLMSGSYDLSIQDVITLLTGQFELAGDKQALMVVMELRLPRSLVALMVGALFALSGTLLQNLTRNPMADPSLVGISQGAALAVVTMTMLLPELLDSWREIAAFSGAISVALLIRALTGKGQTFKFILLGIGVAALVSAFTSAFLTYGNMHSAISALTWLAGNISRSDWPDVKVLFCAFLGLISLAIMQSRNLSVIALGDDVAIGLGAAIKRISAIQLCLSVAAAAIATAVVGPIGFVGLLAPHATKRLVHSGATNHLINSVLVGALIVLSADLLGRTLFAPSQLAAGLVTALIGAPMFAYLLMKK
jgi:iron complex transport system permease protein